MGFAIYFILCKRMNDDRMYIYVIARGEVVLFFNSFVYHSMQELGLGLGGSC